MRPHNRLVAYHGYDRRMVHHGPCNNDGHWETRLLFWEVLAYAILDILTEMEACNWNSRLYLKSHNIY